VKSQQVVRSYLVIAGLYTLSASLIWGVNTLFLLDAGLDILGVFVANAVFTGSMAFFEIPTGVLADTRGRRTSFLLSVGVVLIGTLGYVGAAAAGGSLLLFSLMSVILGLGYTFYSGAVEAWLVDALNATGYAGQLDQVFARGSIVSGAAMLIGTVGGGLLGSLDLAVPFLARAGLLAGVFGIAFFTMHDVGFAPRTLKSAALLAEMRTIAQMSITYGWRERSVRLLIIASFIQGIFLAWGFYAWQPYFRVAGPGGGNVGGRHRRRADLPLDHSWQYRGRVVHPLLRATHHAHAVGGGRPDRRSRWGRPGRVLLAGSRPFPSGDGRHGRHRTRQAGLSTRAHPF
jgi:MFS family permease